MRPVSSAGVPFDGWLYVTQPAVHRFDSIKTGKTEMDKRSEITRQVLLIEEAMRHAGIWLEYPPEWVHTYTGSSARDVWSWLQFVHLPHRLRGLSVRLYLAPQLKEYLDPGLREHRELIHRLIELDSMTPVVSADLK